MLRVLLAPLLHPVRLALRRAAFGAVGLLFLLVGVAFLIAAASIALTILLGPMLAMLILGLVFVGVGLIVLAAGWLQPGRTPPAVQAPPPVSAPKSPALQAELIAAFVEGIKAGKAIRRP